MQSSLVVAALFCLTTWMSLVNATYRPGENCCVKWSKTRIQIEKIVNYTIQSEDTCRIRAVLFLTERGKTICSDPNADWSIRAIQKVDNDMKALQAIRQNEEGSASEVTPAASAASAKSKRGSQRNGRRGKGQKRKNGRGNKKQQRRA